MKPKILTRGAEAIIYKTQERVTKDRIKKSYRHPELDKKIRKRRTKAESKILEKASKLIPVPELLDSSSSEFKITMSYLPGKKLSEYLSEKNYRTISKQIGKNLALLHNEGIIHGDLTTSNLILENKKLYFIDFGLSFHSDRAEDKAVDLHLISQALEAKHPSISKKVFNSILQSYKSSSNNYYTILTRLKKVESRGRYKTQY